MPVTYNDMQDKVVVVTGGGSGIGEATVRAFAHQRARIGFLDIALQPSRALQRELEQDGVQIHFAPCDLTDITALQAGMAAVRRHFGPIQILINNAANDERHAAEAVTEQLWDSLIALNLKHQFFCAQAVLPDMKAAGTGVIVNLGSITWMLGQGGMVAYSACKSAVLGLTRSLARDYGQYGIRVNAVAPGWIMTQRQLDRWVTPQAEAEIMARQCLKRKLQPAEVANFIVFLASEQASACTNQQYVVDGGWV